MLGWGNLLWPYEGEQSQSLCLFLLQVRLVSEIAFDEWVDTRNHFTLQGFAEKIDTSAEHDTRYGIALGYTF